MPRPLAILCCIPLLSTSALLLAGGPARALLPWKALKNQPGVDASQVGWLDRQVPAPALEELALLVQQLSKPEAVRVLPAFGGLGQAREPARASLEPLAQPVPSGAAGQVLVMFRVAQAREAFSLRMPYGPRGWDAGLGELRLPPEPKGAPLPGLVFHLNLEPARRLLDILATREQDPAVIQEALEAPEVRPVFEGLVQHRSEPFYGAPLSMELLAQNLAWASSPAPLMRLYGWANPSAFLNYAHVQRYRTAYSGVIRELAQAQGRVEAAVVGQLSPLVPPEARFSRTVNILFCGGTDGWAAQQQEGVDLEFHGRNFETLTRTLVHESFHGLQSALGPEEVPSPDPLARAWQEGLEILYREGTASYAEPCLLPDPAAMAAHLKKGYRLLEELDQAVHGLKDAEGAQRLINQGTRGAGPFYWVGREMTRTIVAAQGLPALHAILRQGTPAFLRAYREALRGQPDPGLLPKGFLEKALS